jgi:hypothetical protein
MVNRGEIDRRRIAKSLFPCPDEVEGLAEVPCQVVGTSPNRKIVRHVRDQPQHSQSRVSQNRQAFRQAWATTPLAILVPPTILDERKPVLDRPMATHPLHQPLWADLVPAQARDQIAGLAPDRHARLGDFGIDAKDQIEAREVRRLPDVIDLLAVPDPKASDLDLGSFFSMVWASGACSEAS